MPQGCTTLSIIMSDKAPVPVQTPALPCPKCRQGYYAKGKIPQGANRIGNRRSTCDVCNNFSQNVMRIARKRLKDLHEEEYQRIRMQVELDLYPQVISDWNEMHPEVSADDIQLDEFGMVTQWSV